MSVSSVDAAVTVLRHAPKRVAVFTDFDGTLAAIVDDPASATPLPGAVEVLGRLATSLGRVGVLSGRPLTFLVPLFPNDVFLAGLYGLEVRDHGRRRDEPDGARWRDVVATVVADARSGGPDDVDVEDKGLSLTLHYRRHPQRADAAVAWATDAAQRSGLVVRPARQSVELHPPVDVDKGTALAGAAGDVDAVWFIGDDVGDLPAFRVLEQLAMSGVAVARCVVGSDEADPVLAAHADVTLDGPKAVVTYLNELADVAGIG